MSTSTIIKAGADLVHEMDWHGPKEINEAAAYFKDKSNDYAVSAWKRKQYAKLAKVLKEAMA